MKISDAGLSLIRTFEGLSTKAYKCPAGVWTIGYGHTAGVKAGQVITEKQADELLKRDLVEYEHKIENWCKNIKLTQSQFDALVSFEFNTKGDTLPRSTIFKRLQAGDMMGAADAFLMWDKVSLKGVKVRCAGLHRRREAERRLFLSEL